MEMKTGSKVTGSDIVNGLNDYFKGIEGISSKMEKMKKEGSVTIEQKFKASGLEEMIEGYDKLIELMKQYKDAVGDNKNKKLMSSYYGSEEKMINNLREAWNNYVKERKAGDTAVNITKSSSAKEVLKRANALDAAYGEGTAYWNSSEEVRNLIENFKALESYSDKKWSFSIPQFKELYDQLREIKDFTLENGSWDLDLGKVFETIDIPNFSTIENAVEEFETLAEKVNKVKGEYSYKTRDEMKSYLDSRGRESSTEYGLNDIFQNYSEAADRNLASLERKLQQLEKRKSSYLDNIELENNALAGGRGSESDYYNLIDEYDKVSDKIQFIKSEIEKLQSEKPTASIEDSVKTITESAETLSNIFSNLGEGSGLTAAAEALERIKASFESIGSAGSTSFLGDTSQIQATISALQELRGVLDSINQLVTGISNPLSGEVAAGQQVTERRRQSTSETEITRTRSDGATVTQRTSNTSTVGVTSPSVTAASTGVSQASEAFNNATTSAEKFKSLLQSIGSASSLSPILTQLNTMATNLNSAFNADSISAFNSSMGNLVTTLGQINSLLTEISGKVGKTTFNIDLGSSSADNAEATLLDKEYQRYLNAYNKIMDLGSEFGYSPQAVLTTMLSAKNTASQFENFDLGSMFSLPAIQSLPDVKSKIQAFMDFFKYMKDASAEMNALDKDLFPYEDNGFWEKFSSLRLPATDMSGINQRIQAVREAAQGATDDAGKALQESIESATGTTFGSGRIESTIDSIKTLQETLRTGFGISEVDGGGFTSYLEQLIQLIEQLSSVVTEAMGNINSSLGSADTGMSGVDDKVSSVEQLYQKVQDIRQLFTDAGTGEFVVGSSQSGEAQISVLDEIIQKLQEYRSALGQDTESPLGQSIDQALQSAETLRASIVEGISGFELPTLNTESIETAVSAATELGTALERMEETSAGQTSQAVTQAAEAITQEGDAAAQAASQKEEFAKANQEVATSALATETSTRQASSGITEEAVSATKTTERLSIQESSIDKYEQTINRYKKIQDQLLNMNPSTKTGQQKAAQLVDLSGTINDLKTQIDSMEGLSDGLRQRFDDITNSFQSYTAGVENEKLFGGLMSQIGQFKTDAESAKEAFSEIQSMFADNKISSGQMSAASDAMFSNYLDQINNMKANAEEAKAAFAEIQQMNTADLISPAQYTEATTAMFDGYMSQIENMKANAEAASQAMEEIKALFSRGVFTQDQMDLATSAFDSAKLDQAYEALSRYEEFINKYKESQEKINNTRAGTKAAQRETSNLEGYKGEIEALREQISGMDGLSDEMKNQFNNLNTSFDSFVNMTQFNEYFAQIENMGSSIDKAKEALSKISEMKAAGQIDQSSLDISRLTAVDGIKTQLESLKTDAEAAKQVMETVNEMRNSSLITAGQYDDIKQTFVDTQTLDKIEEYRNAIREYQSLQSEIDTSYTFKGLEVPQDMADQLSQQLNKVNNLRSEIDGVKEVSQEVRDAFTELDTAFSESQAQRQADVDAAAKINAYDNALAKIKDMKSNISDARAAFDEIKAMFDNQEIMDTGDRSYGTAVEAYYERFTNQIKAMGESAEAYENAQKALQNIKYLNTQGVFSGEQVSEATNLFNETDASNNLKKYEAYVKQYKTLASQIKKLRGQVDENGESKVTGDMLTQMDTLTDQIPQIEAVIQKYEEMGVLSEKMQQQFFNLRNSFSVAETSFGGTKADPFADINTAYQKLIESAEKYQDIKYRMDNGGSFSTNEAIWFNEMKAHYEELTDASGRYKDHLDEVSDATKQSLSQAMDEGQIKAYSNRISEIDSTLSKLGEQSGRMPGFSNTIKNLQSQAADLRKELSNVDMSDSSANQQLEKIAEKIRALNVEIERARSNSYSIQVDSGAVASLDAQILKWQEANSGAGEFLVQAEQVRQRLGDIQTEGERIDLENKFKSIAQAAEEAGKTGKSLTEVLQGGFSNLGRYLATFVSFYKIVDTIKKAVGVVKELDTALKDMSIVSNETRSSLQDFQKESFDIADAVGTTGKQIQNSTTDWMRLGESLTQAKESAKLSSLLLNISEFDSIDTATEALTSMSQAYADMEKIDIIDKLNNIGRLIA